MKVVNEWTDDHQACVEFVHNDLSFSVWWTSRKMIGCLELVEAGKLSLEDALADYQAILKIINTPVNCVFDSTGEGEADCDSDDLVASYQTCYGYVEVDNVD